MHCLYVTFGKFQNKILTGLNFHVCIMYDCRGWSFYTVFKPIYTHTTNHHLMRVLFTILFALLLHTTVDAQCTSYDYSYAIEGFAECDGPDGFFCIRTSADQMSDISCASDYEFQLTFPTGDFVYTDLGDWAARSVDPFGQTILGFQADALFDNFSEGCLEGRI